MLCCWLWVVSVGSAGAASIAVFPLQELGEGRNDANLELTRELARELARGDHPVVAVDTVLTFMAHNRIRTLGHLETYHITRVRTDLGAAYVLLGTVSQRRERPEPSLGLTLNLIRTSDARTVWTYVGCVSSSEERRLLGIGEPRSVEELQRLMVAEFKGQWPNHLIRTAQAGGSTILLDMARVEPRQLRPGEVLRTQVRLREVWTGNYLPQVSFEVAGQTYPARLDADGRTYTGNWPAQGDDGSYPVNLLIEWPDYERSEKVLLGDYRVDGSAPVVTMDLRGVQQIDGEAVFNHQVSIIPRLLVRKPLSRWRLAFYAETGNLIGEMEGEGALPEQFVWEGRSSYGRADDGRYRIVLNVWDLAGNPARAEHWLGLNRSLPKVAFALEGHQDAFQVDLSHEGKVPLDFWRMELWTREGKLLVRQEGQELPVSVALGAADLNDLQGFVFAQDVLGNQLRQDVRELLPAFTQPPAREAEEEQRVLSERWVDEF
jgi:TolB-like protein